MSDGPRYTVIRQGEHVGILDRDRGKFAPFFETGPTPVSQRVRRAVIALNVGEETPTGYAWEQAS